MDIFWQGSEHPRAHGISIEKNLHNPEANPDSVEAIFGEEPAFTLEARIDNISDEAVSLIQSWLTHTEQRRKITRKEILDLLIDHL